MLIKIATADDANHETWIDPLAVAAIKRITHAGRVSFRW